MDENIPGLAMSRSFGDQIASQVGVISEPGKYLIKEEIMEFNFTKNDRFIVLASDGIWEFIMKYGYWLKGLRAIAPKN